MKNFNKNKFKNFALILFGFCWILIGVKTLFNPVYYFRGAYVNFTGYNKEVGTGLIVIGIILICGYFWKGVKQKK
jgi:uncharacterized membrane protein HdeD (DUF308 family)